MTYDLQLQIHDNSTTSSEVNVKKENGDVLNKSNKQQVESFRSGNLKANVSLSSSSKQIKHDRNLSNASKTIKNVNRKKRQTNSLTTQKMKSPFLQSLNIRALVTNVFLNVLRDHIFIWDFNLKSQ